MKQSENKKHPTIEEFRNLFSQLTENETYEEVYEKWLRTKPSEESRELMRPTKRRVAVCLPKCIDASLNPLSYGEAEKVLNGLFCEGVRNIIRTLTKNMKQKGE